MSLGAREGAALVVVTGLVAGCGASISLVEHDQILSETKTGYEERLARHRRDAVAAHADTEQCRARTEAREALCDRRIFRLERSLARKEAALGVGELRRRRREGRGEPAEGSGLEGLEVALNPVLPSGARLARAPQGWTVVIPDEVLFEAGASRLTARGRAALSQLGGPLADRALRVTVVGHADPGSSADLGWPLSAARARVTVEALQQAGVDPSRLMLQAHAGYAPDPAGVGGRIEVSLSGDELDGGLRRRD